MTKDERRTTLFKIGSVVLIISGALAIHEATTTVKTWDNFGPTLFEGVGGIFVVMLGLRVLFKIAKSNRDSNNRTD
jgi:hypothetical protein